MEQATTLSRVNLVGRDLPCPAPRFGTLTLNPAVDCTLELDRSLRAGAVHGVRSETCIPGGTGINAARLLAARGARVCAGGLIGADDAAVFRAALGPAVDFCFLSVPAPTRRNLMLRTADREHKINRPGFPGLAFDWPQVRRAAAAVADRADIVILSGSLPERFPPGLYARLIRYFHRRGLRVVLDAHGAALARAIDARPEWIKPNRPECEALLGTRIRGADGVGRALRALARRVPGAILSDGARGAAFAGADGAYFVAAPPVRTLDSTGAGDALLAQFCFDVFTRGFDCVTVCRAVAAGAAAVERFGGATPDVRRIDALAASIEAQTLFVPARSR